MELFLDNNNGAIFSDDRKYRYVLWRSWDNEKPRVMFIGLNPSTANESTDDLRVYAELSRDIVFAWGNFKEAELRARDIIQQFHSATCLGVNKNGSPKHPLYISAKATQLNFNLIQQPKI